MTRRSRIALVLVATAVIPWLIAVQSTDGAIRLALFIVGFAIVAALIAVALISSRSTPSA